MIIDRFSHRDTLEKHPESLVLFGEIYNMHLNGSMPNKNQLRERIFQVYPDIDPQKLDEYLEPLDKDIIIIDGDNLPLTDHGLTLAKMFQTVYKVSAYEIVPPKDDRRF
jgi:hypothetical protein